MASGKRTFLVDGYQPKPRQHEQRGYQAQGIAKKPGTSAPPRLPKTVSAVQKPKSS